MGVLAAPEKCKVESCWKQPRSAYQGCCSYSHACSLGLIEEETKQSSTDTYAESKTELRLIQEEKTNAESEKEVYKVCATDGCNKKVRIGTFCAACFLSPLPMWEEDYVRTTLTGKHLRIFMKAGLLLDTSDGIQAAQGRAMKVHEESDKIVWHASKRMLESTPDEPQKKPRKNTKDAAPTTKNAKMIKFVTASS